MGVGFFLVFAVAAALLAACALARSESRRKLAAHLLTLIPAALIALVVTGAQDRDKSERWRVSLEGFRFQLGGDQRISFGGNPSSTDEKKADDIYIPRIATGLVTVGVGSPGKLTLISSGEPDVASSGLAAVRGNGQLPDECNASLDPHFGGRCIAAGTRFCVTLDDASCASLTTTLTWSKQQGAARLRDAEGRDLCALTMRERREAGDPEIFFLAAYAKPACDSEIASAWQVGNVFVRDFLYWRDGRLYLVPAPGRAFLLEKARGEPLVHRSRAAELGVGEAANLHLYRFEHRPRALASQNEVGQESWLKEVRSVEIRHLEGTTKLRPLVEVMLHTRESRILDVGKQPEISITSRKSNPAKLSDQASLIGFDTIGETTAGQLLNVIKLQKGRSHGTPNTGTANFDPCRAESPSLVVRSATYVSCVPLGHWFAIGDPEQVQAKVRVARLHAPTIWIFGACVLVLLNLLVRAAIQLSIEARVVLAFVELMLALRILIAFDSAAVDWRQEGTVAAAWLALFWIPFVFECFARSYARRMAFVSALLVKALVGLGATAVILSAIGIIDLDFANWGRLRKQDAFGVAVVLGFLVLALTILRLNYSAPVKQLSARFSKLSPALAAALLLTGIAVLHFSVAAAGFREQVSGIRISALLVPVLVIAWGYWYSVFVDVRSQNVGTACLGLVAAFVPMGAFAFARDNGAYVYFLALSVFLLPIAWSSITQWWEQSLLYVAATTAIFLGVLAWLAGWNAALSGLSTVMLVASGGLGIWLHRNDRLKLEVRGFWAVPFGCAVAAIFSLHLAGLFLSPESHGGSQRRTMSDLATAVELKGNMIRLFDHVAPRMIEDLGLREGYEQRMAMSEMRSYAATLNGRGWPNQVAPRELINTHVDDAVSAVHLIAPFGRIGSAGVAGFLIVFAAGIAAMLRSRSDARAQQGRLAAVMIAFVSIYMLFANVGLLPFTGRNFYLLSVASSSDLLEGGLLLAIVLMAFNQQPSGASQ